MIQYRTELGLPVVEITVEGKVADSELRANIERLRQDLEENGKTRLIEIIRHFSGIEPKAVLSDMTLGMPLARKVTHVAVVADQRWIRAVSHLGHLFTTAELKIFALKNLAQAREWISQA